MKNNPPSSLPYLNGGPPDAFRGFTRVEAVVSIISCVLSVISAVILLIQGQWTSLFSVPLTIFATKLTVDVYTGLKKIRQGDCSGAGQIESACKSRRVLVWVSFGLGALVMLISALSSRNSGSGLLGFAVGIGLSLLIVLPMIYYYKDVEQIMGTYVYREVADGRPSRVSGPVGQLTALCVGFAVLMIAAAAALPFLPIRGNNTTSILITISRLGLYLMGARFLLVNLCYHGFLRSHSFAGGENDAAFAPTGYSEASAFIVFGSILFGWFALSSLNGMIQTLSNHYYITPWSPIKTGIACAAYALFGLALTRKPWRSDLAIFGAVLMIVMEGVSMFSTSLFWYIGQDAVLIAFFGMLLVAAILRMKGKPVSKAFGIVMIVLAAAYTGLSIAFTVSNIIGAFSYYVLNFLYWMLDDALFLIALLALARAFTGPAASGPDGAQTQKEILPDQLGA